MEGQLIRRLKDYFSLAVTGMAKRKLRSWLTMLGIFVGIAAVVGLVSISQGLRGAIADEFSTVGSDRVILQPGSAFFGPPGSSSGLSKVTQQDIDLVKKIRGVNEVAGFVFKTTRFEFNDKTKFVLGIGIPADDSINVFGSRFEVSEGRQFRSGEKSVAIVGNSYSTDETILGKPVKIGDKVLVEGEEFKVVGIRRKLGDPTNDVSVVVPIEAAWDLYGNKDEYSMVTAAVETGFSPSEVAARVKEDIRKDRNQEEGNEDFQVQTSEELFSSVSSVLDIVQVVIIGIAAISLVVGSIGVMNTMYTAVLERTKEIGILKAIGAKNTDVMLLFLIESGLYGFIGGFIGIIFGLGMGKTVEFAASRFLGSELLRASTSPYLIFGALAFSFVLGCMSGVAPARQAARLSPVKALRYE